MLQPLLNTQEGIFMNNKKLIGFLTAGDPNINTTKNCILEMVKAGIDLIQIGIPFSDPIAEDIEIQAANLRSLKNNTNISDIFTMIEEIRTKTNIPIILLSYINPILNYGYEKFFKECNKLQINYFLCPDIPFEEREEIQQFADENNINIISVIAPSPIDRIKQISTSAKGYIYIASDVKNTAEITLLINIIKQSTQTPIAAEFDIQSSSQSNLINLTDAIITGNNIVNIIAEYKENSPQKVYEYIRKIKTFINY